MSMTTRDGLPSMLLPHVDMNILSGILGRDTGK